MTLFKATVQKQTQDSKLGIAFSRANGESPLTVKLIRPESLFMNSDIRAGMIVHSINDQPMTWKTPKEAADLLRCAQGGQDLTLSCQAVKGTIYKSKLSKHMKLGISLKNSTKVPGIFISKISPSGAFGPTDLKDGMKVLYINDIPCPTSTNDAIQLVKDADDELTLLCIPTNLVPPPLAEPRTTTPPSVKSTTREESESSPAANRVPSLEKPHQQQQSQDQQQQDVSPVPSASGTSASNAEEEKKDDDQKSTAERSTASSRHSTTPNNKEHDKDRDANTNAVVEDDTGADSSTTGGEQSLEKKGLLDNIFSACIC